MREDSFQSFSDRKCLYLELTTQQQTTAFLLAFILGIALSLMYIVICVVRKLSPPGRKELFFGDIVWMIFVSLVNFLFAVSQTDGRIRFYSAAAEIMAFILLWLTAGRLLLKGTDAVKSFIWKLKTKMRKLISALLGKIVVFRERKKIFEKK